MEGGEMKWEKSRLGGCHVLISDVITIEVYKSYSSRDWVYYFLNRRSIKSYETMREAKKEAIKHCENILAKGLAQLEKGKTK